MPQRPLKLVKRQISFAIPDFEWLLVEAGGLGISVSELVRSFVRTARERARKSRR
jgi:hypothetical protein